MNGILLIDKPKDITSFDVIFRLRKFLHTKKIGHAGTLDPFATGLLVIGVNQGTKSLQFIENDDKEYIATLKLGIKTNSGDLTGEVIENKTVPILTHQQINEVLKGFLGVSYQLPPMLSALKVKGKKLYELARLGLVVERESRKIVINEALLIDFNQETSTITFKVICSKGTYIRTLGEDIALKLNTVGHLTTLSRTKIGKLGLAGAYTLEDIENGNFSFINISDALSYKKYVLKTDEEIKAIKEGKRLLINSDESRLLIVDRKFVAIAVYEKVEKNEYKSIRGLFSE